MTLEEYKSQCKAIKEEAENFEGTQEEAIKFLEDLATKYPEVNEFNTKALQCNDVAEFKKLADSVGMKFSDDDSAEKLYSFLDGTKKQLQIATKSLEDGVELDDSYLAKVSAGWWGSGDYDPAHAASVCYDYCAKELSPAVAWIGGFSGFIGGLLGYTPD